MKFQMLFISFLLVLASCGGSGGGSVGGDTPTSSPPPVVVTPTPNPTPDNGGGEEEEEILPDIEVSCENPADEFGEDGYPFHAKGRFSNLEYYLICTGSQLAAIASSPIYLDKNFLLGDYIDMATYYDDPVNPTNQFIIGDDTNPFTGFFFGDTYSISNLIFNNTDGNYCSLFGRIDTAEIQYLMIINPTFTTNTSSFCGGVVGRALGSYVSHVGVKGGSVSGTIVGGIAGQLDNTEVENSYSSAELSSIAQPAYLGGLAGFSEGPTVVENYFFDGVIQSVPGDTFGGMLAITPLLDMEEERNNLSIVNSYYNVQSGASGACGSSSATCGGLDVTQIDTSIPGFESYFYLETSEPISSWDIRSWEFFANEHPVLD